MKTITLILLTALLFIARLGHSQSFINLNFEGAVINTNGAPPFSVVASSAILGWTAYIGGIAQTYIVYDTIPLAAAEVTLQGTNTSIPSLFPIQGDFTIALFGAAPSAPQQQSAAIGQTGQIPVNALSLIFWGNVGLSDVSFNGQTLAVSLLGSTANYNIYGANISSYAGQTGQLLFASQPGTSDVIDNIQFSTSPVPEPNIMGLLALGGLFLAACRRQKI